MKFFSKINNFFYSEEKKWSDTQIREDFGDFPPLPLNCININYEFNIVRTRGIGNLYIKLIEIRNFYKAIYSDVNLLSHELVGFHNKKWVLDFKKGLSFFNKSIKKRILLFILITLLSPVIIPMFVVNMYRSKKNGLGYFLAIFKHDDKLIIKTSVIYRKKINEECIISHEHIHFLQSRNFEQHSRCIRNPSDLIVDQYKDNKTLLYLLEKEEIEARLHEINISYYRTKKELPLTVDGFLELLAGSNEFGDLIIEFLDYKNIKIRNNIIKYNQRGFAKDFAFILSTIKDRDLEYKFISEVLTVMYGNLIKYYGDEKSSLKFMRQIERPNLYDTLYI